MHSRWLHWLTGSLIATSLFALTGNVFAENAVTINGYVINVKGKEPAVPKDLEPSGAGRYKKYIVQFTGPVDAKDKKQLVDLGCRVGDYLPEFAFVVTMNAKTKKQVETLPFINGIVRYQPAYKVTNKLKDASGSLLTEQKET